MCCVTRRNNVFHYYNNYNIIIIISHKHSHTCICTCIMYGLINGYVSAGSGSWALIQSHFNKLGHRQPIAYLIIMSCVRLWLQFSSHGAAYANYMQVFVHGLQLESNVISTYVCCTYMYVSLNYVRNYLSMLLYVNMRVPGLLSSDKYVPDTNLELEHILLLYTTDALMCIVIRMRVS